MNVIRTPMKVFKEARARGDKATMERAMGYVEKAHDDAREHKYSADEGLKQEAEENRLKAEQQREEPAQRIRENREELEKRIKESGDGNEAAASKSTKADAAADCGETAAEAVADAVSVKGTEGTQPAPVTYTRSGEVRTAEVKKEFTVTV